MSDAFFEVDEQLRSERLRGLFQRGWPVAITAAVVAFGVFLAVWGWNAFQQNRSQRASDSYAQGLDALAKGDFKTADARLAEVAKSGPAAYRALALMQQGGIRVTQHKDAEAVGLLDQAAKATSAPVLTDAARLKAAMLLIDTRPLAEVEARLTPLAAQNRPYRWLAREAIGLARLQAGRLKEARGDFAVLSLAQDVSDSSRNRARAAMALIDDGTASSLPGLVKTALAAPPTPAVASGLPAGAAPPTPAPITPAAPAGAPQ